ncbi:MAG: hypothetical protein K0R09_1972 [Clostridiales bacterium]|jgi:small-conductance mechanosensitive channel|nr:hypothetical protein [Clostridiales bacterium]
MKELFCSCKANNNEEYKKVIRARMKRMILLFVIGIITLVAALLPENMWTVSINEQMLGVYSGIGVGLIVASVILWIKNKLILADEEKLKESRLSNTDERIQEISSKALRVAAIVLLIALYALGLIGGLFYPVLVKILLSMVFVFLIAYLIAYKIYEKRM